MKSLKNCRLYVCDYLSTSFIEALSVNKPTILFWDSQVNELRPAAKKYYDKLREVGILYDTSEGAAAIINNIYDDVKRWWNETNSQEARWDFCIRFARTAQNAVNVGYRV